MYQTLNWITDIPVLGKLVIVILGIFIVPLLILSCMFSCYGQLKNIDLNDEEVVSKFYDSTQGWLYLVAITNACCLVYGLPGKWDGFLILLGGWILGTIPAIIAYSKGRKLYTWYLYGHLIFILALPHAIFLSTNEEGLIRGGSYKTCPHCAEVIKKEAKICKHCHKNLE